MPGSFLVPVWVNLSQFGVNLGYGQIHVLFIYKVVDYLSLATLIFVCHIEMS